MRQRNLKKELYFLFLSMYVICIMYQFFRVEKKIKYDLLKIIIVLFILGTKKAVNNHEHISQTMFMSNKIRMKCKLVSYPNDIEAVFI